MFDKKAKPVRSVREIYDDIGTLLKELAASGADPNAMIAIEHGVNGAVRHAIMKQVVLIRMNLPTESALYHLDRSKVNTDVALPTGVLGVTDPRYPDDKMPVQPRLDADRDVVATLTQDQDASAGIGPFVKSIFAKSTPK